MSILVLQSSWWGRESWLLCLICLPGVTWWLSGSSTRCHGVVCGLWLWYFLIILTYYFQSNLGSFFTTRIYSVEPLLVIMVQKGRLNRGSFSLWPSTVELNDWKALFMTSFLIICKKYILYSSERVVNLKWSRTSSLPIQGKHLCLKFQQKNKWVVAPIEDSDQPVYPRRLIRAFVGRSIGS